MSRFAKIVDSVLEASVIGSFTNIGSGLRNRLEQRESLPAMDGKHVVVTGATSGIGEFVAESLQRLGATVTIIARNPDKARATLERWQSQGLRQCQVVTADLGELATVRSAAERLLADQKPVDVLIHNAGALDAEFATTTDGIERTLASHVVGPLVLTQMLLPLLVASQHRPSRVLWVSSGGMYTQPLHLDELEMTPANYDGATAYARAKRAQIVVTEELARRVPSSDVVFHAMHPGWVDTPGVERGMPRFYSFMRPLLRNHEAGADTLLWLAASEQSEIKQSGGFWHDRRRRKIHRGWTTSKSDTEENRERLMAKLFALGGIAQVS